jgi:hypothetical protein
MWLGEPLNGAVGLLARLQAEINLAGREQEADRVAGLHRKVQALGLVHLGGRRNDRHRCERGDLRTDVALGDGPQHGDPRLIASGDPLPVYARGGEHA